MPEVEAQPDRARGDGIDRRTTADGSDCADDTTAAHSGGDRSSRDSSDDEPAVYVDKGKGKAVESSSSSEDDEDEEGEGENDDEEEEEDDDDEEEDDEDEEPRLKYARLTQNVNGLYRNGDATSTFLVAGDKMIVGTHNGNIHVFQLPTFQPLRVYHAHSASVTCISISPSTPPLPTVRTDQISKLMAEAGAGATGRPGSSRLADTSPTTSPRKAREPLVVPNTPSNNIYIATASTDGNVCVQSLIDVKDVQLRNFGRPVQAVALSPEYKQDRTYLSGGLAANLILTVGGGPGRSTSTTIGTAAAAASGWLGSMGLGSNTGRDTILHSGEGTVSTIQWSLSGRYVAWLNEHGIKIMRTRLHLDSADVDSAWKRIGHIDRPQTEEWDTMASVWKGRAQWIDEQNVDDNEDDDAAAVVAATEEPSPAAKKLKQQQARSNRATERLLVGWGSTIWIIHVHAGGVGVGKHAGERLVGRAEIVKILRMDCIISGISLYTQNLLLVLAYCMPDPEDEKQEEREMAARGHRPTWSTASASSEPSGGIRRRQNNQPPELRLIDLTSQVEVDKDGLSVSRFERLSAGDYHLGVLPAQTAAAAVSSRGAFETIAELGADMWNAAFNPRSLFGSGQSIRSRSSNEAAPSTRAASTAGTIRASRLGTTAAPGVHPSLVTTGIKIFIHSPYDCILATKRDLSDHLAWLLEHEAYQRAWELIDEHPEAVPSVADRTPDMDSSISASAPDAPSTQGTAQASDDFYADSVLDALSREANAPSEREKRRVGELWIKAVVDAGDWERAGQIAGKVLRSADRWEKWVWTFASAGKFDELTNYIPTEPLQPPIPRTIYEIVLGHYLKVDKLRFRELLERWPTELFDIHTVVTALENQLNYRDVREDSIEDGERGRDWRIVVESLARMHEADGRNREALKYFIRLQDADSAFRLIRDSHLADAVIDDIPAFLSLRVPAGQTDALTRDELEELTAEAVGLLVEEAQHGLVQPSVVVDQLQARELHLYTFFYLRGLWRGDGLRRASISDDGADVASGAAGADDADQDGDQGEHPLQRSILLHRHHHHVDESRERLVAESRAQLDMFGDLAVQLFARFDQGLLMEFLKASTAYSFEQAAAVCERANYVDELVYLYSKTGQVKRALYLIIDRLGDVRQAIAFAKELDDPDLWEDLLNYSMDKPQFIRGLLEEVGTAIDPITLVRRIPEGLEIEGLRDGLQHIMKEHEIQHSISMGVARVLRSEVSTAQATLRRLQQRGIKFEVPPSPPEPTAEAAAAAAAAAAMATVTGDMPPPSTATAGDDKDAAALDGGTAEKTWTPGHCAQCLQPLAASDADLLVGFACGHVFHLPHLLGLAADDLATLGIHVDRAVGGRRHMLSTKITHARLLRDRIQGCTVCKARQVEA